MRDLPGDGVHASRLVQRLNRLEELDLAQSNGKAAWRLHQDLQPELIRLADRRARDRATARMLANEPRVIEKEHFRELEAAHSSQRVTGRIVGLERLGDDPKGAHLLGVDGIISDDTALLAKTFGRAPALPAPR